jgi:biopolymer transport protein ExbD
MVISPMLDKLKEQDIKVTLPMDSRNQSLSTVEDLTAITVRGDGAYIVGGEVVTTEKMIAILKQGVEKNKDMKILVRGDKDAKHMYVANAIAVCRAVGITQANIGYQVP